MSFQHFRLQGIHPQPPAPHPDHMLQQSAPDMPLPSPLTTIPLAPPNPDHMGAQAHLQGAQFQVQLDNTDGDANSKPPYGSGDMDDGYTLVFASMDDFQAWRLREEEEKMVEFVKGDTHGSKAVPPRFKDHTKLVCARHSRSGRKKYVKKHPERQRKVPSRKLEGQGCPASISYKTYYGSDQVRACYSSQHSHEIGLANLPFTRRGRKQQVEQEKERSKINNSHSSSLNGAVSMSPVTAPVGLHPSVSPHINAIAGPSRLPMHAQPSASRPPMHSPPMRAHPPPHHTTHVNSNTVSMMGTLPAPIPPQQTALLGGDPWDRLSLLFENIREHARTFEYPTASVTVLESVLIRLYLESPINGDMPQMHGMHIMHNNVDAMHEVGDIHNGMVDMTEDEDAET